MRRVPGTRYLQCAAACSLLLGCRPEAEPAAAAAAAEPPAAAVADDTLHEPRPERISLLPARIYFRLTDHDWYAHGEPLRHDDQAWHPAGMPIAASLEQMQQAGEYEGVDYYVRDGDAQPAVYVPVFEGYWQVFRPDTTTRRGN
jgi:hypothetical protein